MNNPGEVQQPLTSEPVPKSDDADFAEHLRTVHFALLAVCLGLVVVASSPSQRDISIAHQQIQTIVEVQRQWNAGWLERVAEKRLNETESRFQSGSRSSVEMPTSTAIEIQGDKLSATFTGAPWLIIATNDSRFTRGVFDQSVELEIPKTLTDFRETWDHIPNLRFETSPRLERDKKAFIQMTPLNGGFLNLWSAVPWKEISPSGQYKKIAFKLTPRPPFPEKADGVNIFQRFYLGATLQGDKMKYVALPVSLESRNLDAQGYLVDNFPGRLRHGTFEEVFHELNAATESYQDLRLEVIEKIIRSEMGRSKEAFEAFGVKFPVETTARRGILLLLGVQIYFWLHLAEYRRRKIMNPPVAWIGSYGNTVASIVFSISALAAPVAVVTFVAIRGKMITSPRWLELSAICLVALVSALFALLTAHEYFAVWITRSGHPTLTGKH